MRAPFTAKEILPISRHSCLGAHDESDSLLSRDSLRIRENIVWAPKANSTKSMRLTPVERTILCCHAGRQSRIFFPVDQLFFVRIWEVLMSLSICVDTLLKLEFNCNPIFALCVCMGSAEQCFDNPMGKRWAAGIFKRALFSRRHLYAAAAGRAFFEETDLSPRTVNH